MDVKVPPSLIVLSKQDLTALMPFGSYVDAVADAFRLHAEGRAVSPPPMHIPAEGGGFHVKAGSLPIGSGYTAIKVNGNFPNNRATHGLPTIQGAILLFDTATGSPVALLDSIEITIKRTGAATAVAARYLARPESQSRDDLRLRHARPRPARRATASARYPAGISSRQERGCGCELRVRDCRARVSMSMCRSSRSPRRVPAM